jgi:hypothetical protein
VESGVIRTSYGPFASAGSSDLLNVAVTLPDRAADPFAVRMTIPVQRLINSIFQFPATLSEALMESGLTDDDQVTGLMASDEATGTVAACAETVLDIRASTTAAIRVRTPNIQDLRAGEDAKTAFCPRK